MTRHELLLRVLDETDGPQSPIQVLDTAERLDAVFDIDLWVVERAMQLAAEHTDLNLQINLSGRSVGDPRLTAEVERLIEQYGVNPEQLTFEITETALIGNLTEARRFADRIRDLGCELALDDFGSGLRVVPLPAALPDRPGQDRRGVRGRPGATTRRTRCWCGPWCRCARRTGSTRSPSSCRTSRPCGCCGSWASTTSRAT